MEICKKYAYELSDMLKNREISACELSESVFDRIEATDGKVEAYITTVKENALTQAKQIDERISKGEKMHALAGIPIGIKDNISTKGIKTTCASKMLGNYVPPFNATVIDKINESGMIITGKLNMDEFAMGSSTENSYFKITKNPFDLSRVPGGSSGGSAAAVSSCETVLALGSDTGGSIRQPASYCGVVGLKPTYGSVSRYGLVAFASSLDQIGPIGRCVKDVAMLQSVINGYDRMDSTSAYREYDNLSDKLSPEVKGLKIGIPEEYFGEGIDVCVKNSIFEAVKLFEKNGACIKKISLPSTDYALSSYYILSSAEASSNLARFDGVKYGYRAESFDGLTDMYEKTRSEGFGDEVKRRIMLGTFVLSSGYYDAYYKKAKLLQKRISAEFSSAFEDVDMIITPTVPTTAFKIGENINDPLKMYSTDICTVTINIAGLPALSIPCGKDELGLPIGMQLIGSKFSEQTLLNAAYSFEQTVGGFEIPSII